MKHLLNTLFVMTQGAWLSQKGEEIIVHLDKETRKSYPIHIFESIICFGRVSATGPLLGFCASNGVPISFFSEQGRYLARVDGPVRGNVLLRRQQYRKADEVNCSSKIAQSILIAKLSNSRKVLMRFLRDNNNDENEFPEVTSAINNLAIIAKEISSHISLDELRGFEGDAARCYFGAFNNLILTQKDFFEFKDRNRRPPMDRVNAMLSYVYSLLAHDVASALEGVGLDPAVGYLHRDRPGRPSLALDIMEEFRSWLADRIVLSLINLRQVDSRGFTISENGAVTMDEVTRKKIIAAWQSRKQDELTHPFIGEKISIGLLPHIQARLLAKHIRGDLEAYPPFVWR
ncbi:MAG: type I-C CRISPR-associated endonuclease Cas1 [Clostridiaceae bacterium]|jgi:CRISPR-associated protein Cas1|nr:type I-C CRISPR-associated endonuclease Cas1 [Clostridiaceae bacterium]